MPFSKMNAEMPLLRLLLSVTAIATHVSAWIACVMKFFDPLTIQPPSDFTAVDLVPEASSRRWVQSAPMRQDARSQAARYFLKLFFSAEFVDDSNRGIVCGDRDTNRSIDAREFLDDRRVFDIAHTRAAVLFRKDDTHQSQLASFGCNSTGKCCDSSHSITCGAISDSANSRTLILTCCCSSLNSNSMFVYTRFIFSDDFGDFRPWPGDLALDLVSRVTSAGDKPPITRLQVIVCQGANPHASQLQHRMTDQFKHASHLLVATLVKQDLVPRVRLVSSSLLIFAGAVRVPSSSFMPRRSLSIAPSGGTPFTLTS